MGFENEETAGIMQRRLLPVLEELARAEFGCYSFYGNMSISIRRQGHLPVCMTAA